MTWSTNEEKYGMVYRRDKIGISGGWYGPKVCHDDQEMILICKSEAEKNKWGGDFRGAKGSQNDMHIWP